MKFIGNRISHQKKEGIFSVVIAAGVEKAYERILLMWLLLWTLSGVYFITQLFADHSQELKLYIGILLSFWLYYEIRVGRVYFWRKAGYESIKFVEDKVLISQVILGRSKPKTYFVQNIDQFKADMPKETNVLEFLNNSFWVMGRPYISFQHQGDTISFGRQLTESERKALVMLLNKELAYSKKKS
ncbi:hypothetical protein [Luteibaculum oceani]|uniref:Uncharacterized protein n=1 Tax=Luteibaculum oceani TaxID=1294296 RepID=A0A5C6UYX4_9FLAO|nr:hypothetical protein [Luteibaculum oceani]TXC78683.1 hypothetical protein FRX97_08165 [Luteibaculum oceani]